MVVQRFNRRETFLAMGGLALVVFLVALDQNVVSTAMPQIIGDLNGFTLYAWVTTAYLLAETAIIPIVGKLGDLFGRKWMTIAGVVAFLVASALCGLASSMPALVIFRGLQGIGGGVLLATVFAQVADIFPDIKERARYQGLIFAMFSLSGMVGPVLGGWITDSLGWRWVFYINLPFCLLALAVLPVVLPQSVRQPRVQIDYAGALLSSTAIVGLLVALELVGGGEAWSSPTVLGGLVVAAIALMAFVPVELRAKAPVIPFKLFRSRAMVAATLIQFLIGLIIMSVGLFLPLFAQSVLGLSARASGTVMLPMVVTIGILTVTAGPAIAHFGRLRPLLLAGTGLMALGLLLLATLRGDASPFHVSAYTVVLALGFGLVMPVTTLAVQLVVGQDMLGVATSATTFIRQIGTTVGMAIVGTIVTGNYIAGLASTLPPGMPDQATAALHSPNALTNEAARHDLEQIMASVPDGARLTETVLELARTALAGGIQRGLLVVFGATVLAVLASLLFPRLRLDSPGVPGQPGGDEQLAVTGGNLAPGEAPMEQVRARSAA